MTSASIDSVLQYSSLLLNLVLIARLIQFKLVKGYRFFFCLLIASVILQTFGLIFGTESRRFLQTYTVLEPVRNVLFILVVWELFSAIFRNYAGLRSLSRWVMGVAAAIAPIGLVLTVTGGKPQAFKASAFVSAMVRFERGIAFGLVIFILIMLYFISRYPIKLPRNSVVHCIIYSIWFLGDAGIFFASSFLTKFAGQRLANDGQSLLDAGCYLGWVVLLSRAGEYQGTRVRKDISGEQERALIGELNSLNEMLVRAGRSISHTR